MRNLHLYKQVIFVYRRKKELYELPCKYAEAVSLKNETSTCPNIEVDLEVIGKFPFFITPIHVKEENKLMTDKDMQRLVHMGILKKDRSPY